ncbi:hypothetical protein [uncultured Microscilla sp.]|uniref:slr1659 superfamily regulator n=1 Tax=uncultured Microscilla sp. TaxID=432653 RepID=UPI002621A77F|nr:hypothetical protein [uncultured Microscilla sp.]
MELAIENASFTFDKDKATLSIEGALRLSGVQKYKEEGFFDFLKDAVKNCETTLNLDLTKLQYLNSSGVTAFSRFILEIKKEAMNPIKVTGSSEISWQKKTLPNFPKLWNQIILDFQ